MITKFLQYVSVVSIFTSIITMPVLATAAENSSTVPAQFIAKQYSEVLGRLPDQSGWKWLHDTFLAQGCTENNLIVISKSFLNSGEFAQTKYSNAAKITVLYRAILNREPDQAGLTAWTEHMDRGLPWETTQNYFYGSGEFKQLVPSICNPAIDVTGSSYYFGTTPAPNTVAQSDGFAGTEDALQSALNEASRSNGTVSIAQGVTVKLTKPLVIPANVTLTTTGKPAVHQYVLQGRLVRAADFNDALVKLTGGAKFEHVWVDGARNLPGNYETSRVNVQMLGGEGTSVKNSRLTNSQGWSTVTAMGSAEALPACKQNTISGNVITSYGADHTAGNYTDGLSVSCEDTLIESNQIVDTTDVGIVIFKASGPLKADVAQRSVARNNYILAAGNSMFAAMGFDPLYQTEGRPVLTYDFTGAVFTENTYWTSPATHFDLAITNGSRAWFGGRSDIAANYGKGAQVLNNHVGLFARVQAGTGTNGMLETTVTENNIAYQFVSHGTCPKVANVAAISAGYASGSFGAHVIDRGFDNCIAAE